MKAKQGNNSITEAIMQYISMRTDYAIMLTGAWGSGKTHYVNNVLIPEIEKRCEHKAIVISLFGVSSVEEINIKIFMETLPVLSNGKVQVGGQIAKIALRGAANFFRLGDLEKYSGDIGQVLSGLTHQKKLVVFFDDFERKGNISLSELTGYINMLSEDKSSKVVLIANEEEIPEFKEATDEKNAYQPFKEKLVRSTLYFDPDFDTSLQEVLDAKYSDDYKVYRSFLDNYTEEIKRRFVWEAQNKNLRTLYFALETFNYAFCLIYNWNQTAEKYEDDQLKKYLREMFLFALAICIEYREGAFQDASPNGIDTDASLAVLYTAPFTLSEVKEPEMNEHNDFSLTFRNKYYKSERYFFFQSLFEFVVGKSPFKTEIATGEIDELVKRDSPQHPEWRIYDEAKQKSYYDLGNDEFEKFYDDLLSYAVQGIYPPEDAIVASSHLVKMAEVLRKDTSELEKDLEKGIKESFKKFGGDDKIEEMYSDRRYDDVIQKLIRSAIDQSNELKEEERNSKIEDLNRLLAENFDEFLKEIQHEPFNYEPVLHRIDFSNFAHCNVLR